MTTKEARRRLRAALSGSKEGGSEIPVQVAVKPSNTPINTDRSLNMKKYAELDNINVLVSRSTSEWKDSDFNTLSVYQIDHLNTDDAVLFGEAMMTAISEDTITADTLNMMLRLAVSLRSTAAAEDYMLVSPNDVLTSTILSSKPTVNSNRNASEDADPELQEMLESEMKKTSSKPGKKKGGKKSTAAEVAIKMAQRVRATPKQDNIQSDKTQQAAAYSYIAAYLMRMQCRQPEQVVGSIVNVMNRYNGFYDGGSDVFDNLDLTVSALEKMRDVIARKPEITGTWVAWVAYNENTQKLVKQDRGLLEYLAIQVFAYQGMHVVVQVLAIHQITKIPMGLLLREMDCQMTRSAVMEIFKILRDFQPNDVHQNRSTYFRYARVWNEGYFARVQSKNCPQLLYLAAKTVKDLSPNSTSDPTQIFAVKNMSASMREVLDSVSKKLLALISQHADNDKEAGSIWKGHKFGQG
ncbi:putative N protein [Cytorhabdovirus fragariarugosus]|nr:putative N protein [Cytorhabdovirus fragariarugosus]